MAIDMRQFYEVFFAETEEHLARMESLLALAGDGPVDREKRSTLFRSAHSIKGSSGTFGFTDMAELSGLVEARLKQACGDTGRLPLGLIEAIRAAIEALRSQLAAHMGAGQCDAMAVSRALSLLEAVPLNELTPPPLGVAAAGDVEFDGYGFFAPLAVGLAPNLGLALPNRMSISPSASAAGEESMALLKELIATQAALAKAARGLDPLRHAELLGGLAELERETRALRKCMLPSENEGDSSRGRPVRARQALAPAILDGMLLGVGDEAYVVPMNCVLESLAVGVGAVRQFDFTGKIDVRGERVPALSLRRIFKLAGNANSGVGGVALIVGTGSGRLGLLIDRLIGPRQVRVKRLETNYRRVDGLAGAAILEDGRVALILDVDRLTQAFASGAAEVA